MADSWNLPCQGSGTSAPVPSHFVPNWAKVDGADGFCKVIHRQLTAKSGQKYSVNNIDVYLSPDETIQSEPKF